MTDSEWKGNPVTLNLYSMSLEMTQQMHLISQSPRDGPAPSHRLEGAQLALFLMKQINNIW